MQVRSFQWEDLEAVLDLWRSSGPGIHLGRSDSPEELRKKLEHDPDLFLVAEEGGHVLGAVMGGFDGRRGIVYHLAVHPPARHQGLGTALMSELEGRLRAKGCLKYYLLVTPDNVEAVEFYRRLGWSVMDMTLMGKEID